MNVTVNTTAVAGNKTFGSKQEYTAGSRLSINESIPSAASELDIDVGVSNTGGRLKFVGLRAVGADMKIQLLDDGDTLLDASAEIELDAGQNYFWPAYDGDPDPGYLDEGNIAKVRVDNESDPAVSGTLSAVFLYDPTA